MRIVNNGNTLLAVLHDDEHYDTFTSLPGFFGTQLLLWTVPQSIRQSRPPPMFQRERRFTAPVANRMNATITSRRTYANVLPTSTVVIVVANFIGKRAFNSTRPRPSVEKCVVPISRRYATHGTNVQTAKTNNGVGTVNARRAMKRLT